MKKHPSKTKMHNLSTTSPADPADPEGGTGTGSQEENEEERLLDGDLEIELQPAHGAEALGVLTSIELKSAMLREQVLGPFALPNPGSPLSQHTCKLYPFHHPEVVL